MFAGLARKFFGSANERRIKVGCGIRLAVGLLVAVLGLTKLQV